MAEVMSDHQYRYGTWSCTCDQMWYDWHLPPAQLQTEHLLHVEMELHLSGYGRVTPSVIEWGAGFRNESTVRLYNPYRTQREAESYVKSMGEVGANMVVLTREYTPAVSTDWRVV